MNERNSMSRIAVVGTGSMGKNHVRVLREMAGVELVGLVDPNPAVARPLADRYALPVYASLEALINVAKPEAVVVATPTAQHFTVVSCLLEHGIHVLVEKPIASTRAEGQAMIDMAARQGVVLSIGHVERFNPAVIAVGQYLKEGRLGKLIQIDARRLGPYPQHIGDVGVGIDLAVHELDIIRSLSGSEVVSVFADVAHAINSQREDLLVSVLRLENGTIGTLTISWLSPTKTRELCLTGARGMYRLNYLTQDLEFFENASIDDQGDWDTMQVLRGVSEGQMIRHAIRKKEPLRAELEAFIASVRGEGPVIITGLDGLRALELAEALLTSARERRPVQLDPR